MEWLDPVQGGRTALVARLTELSRDSEETMYDTLIDLMHSDAELLRLAALRLLGLLLGAATAALQPPRAMWSRITHALGGNALSATTYTSLMVSMWTCRGCRCGHAGECRCGHAGERIADVGMRPPRAAPHPRLLARVHGMN